MRSKIQKSLKKDFWNDKKRILFIVEIIVEWFFKILGLVKTFISNIKNIQIYNLKHKPFEKFYK